MLDSGFIEGISEQEEYELELEASEGDRVDVATEMGEDAAKEALYGVTQDLFARFDFRTLATHAVPAQARGDFDALVLGCQRFEFFAHISGVAQQFATRGQYQRQVVVGAHVKGRPRQEGKLHGQPRFGGDDHHPYPVEEASLAGVLAPKGFH